MPPITAEIILHRYNQNRRSRNNGPVNRRDEKHPKQEDQATSIQRLIRSTLRRNTFQRIEAVKKIAPYYRRYENPYPGLIRPDAPP